MSEKTVSTYFDAGAVVRSPALIASDPTLSNARKIELLKSIKEHYCAPEHSGMLRDADLELSKLLRLTSHPQQH